MPALALHYCTQAFSSCGNWGAIRRLLIAVASLLVEYRLQGAWASVVGIFLDQGSNPCPLHWQADS